MSWCDIYTFTDLLISRLADCALTFILLRQLSLHVEVRKYYNKEYAETGRVQVVSTDQQLLNFRRNPRRHW